MRKVVRTNKVLCLRMWNWPICSSNCSNKRCLMTFILNLNSKINALVILRLPSILFSRKLKKIRSKWFRIKRLSSLNLLRRTLYPLKGSIKKESFLMKAQRMIRLQKILQWMNWIDCIYKIKKMLLRE